LVEFASVVDALSARPSGKRRWPKAMLRCRPVAVSRSALASTRATSLSRRRQFLGYRLGTGGTLGIAPKSLQRSKARLRQITKRNRAVSLGQMVDEANAYLTGWVTYFRHARSHSELRGLDGWLRRKLRCVRLKQCKQPAGLRRFLRRYGFAPWQARELASSGRGWWCLVNAPQAKLAMRIAWFDAPGLVNLSVRHTALNAQGNRRGTGPVCPVV
jgi:RNA-directed DNA polymerase